MPYIQHNRQELAKGFIEAEDAGELNFVVTSIITKYLGGSPRYTDFNEVIGVLECAKLELYRRMIVPYEDQKCFDNGDVYV